MRRKLNWRNITILMVVILLVIFAGVTIYHSRSRTLSLIGEATETIEVNTSYEEQGAKLIAKKKEHVIAKPNRGKVDSNTVGTYKLEYKYRWGLVNKKVTRTVKVVDTQAPKLSLIKPDITITKGSSYTEPGYSAIDAYEGDLSSKVVVEGEVNTTKEGVYLINYRVEDASGNASTATRTIRVKSVLTSSDSKSKGVVYLTFDDGPRSETTNQILDILKSEGVKATFFVTGVGSDSVIKRTDAEGHEIALHTYSHEYHNIYKSMDAYYSDLYKIQNRVKNITGKTSMLIRFPGGGSNSISKKTSPGIMTKLTKDVQAKGFKYFDWNVDSGDAGANPTAKSIYNDTISSLSKTRSNVVLMHDTKQPTVDALRDIIRYCKDNGYTFEVMSQLDGSVHHKVYN